MQPSRHGRGDPRHHTYHFVFPIRADTVDAGAAGFEAFSRYSTEAGALDSAIDRVEAMEARGVSRRSTQAAITSRHQISEWSPYLLRHDHAKWHSVVFHIKTNCRRTSAFVEDVRHHFLAFADVWPFMMHVPGNLEYDFELSEHAVSRDPDYVPSESDDDDDVGSLVEEDEEDEDEDVDDEDDEEDDCMDGDEGDDGGDDMTVDDDDDDEEPVSSESEAEESEAEESQV